ncbi:MAG: VCBS repeat-containing protein [Phycisphaeraceae bacterium]|nr:VCBS repeat-containing protein [Phycisphaeraceae bacterium]MCB9847017.1 VCBS repeat-containing protein [Phycisphaeraceae bacterium]
MTRPSRQRLALALTAPFLSLPLWAAAQEGVSLDQYFGFDEARIIVVDNGAGPFLSADLNNDGLQDLAVVNNRKSRIELYLQRRSPRTDDEQERAYKVNEIPPNRYYDNESISVAHRVTALAAHDVTGDGRVDILYAGQPSEIVTLEQKAPGKFETLGKLRVRGLSATRSSFLVADVDGSATPELLAGVDGRINIYTLGERGPVGEPRVLGSGGADGGIVAFFVEDFNGDGLGDVLGVIPEDRAPLRLWARRAGVGGMSGLGAELRFESPPLREVEPVRFPNRAAASVGVIERATERIIIYDFAASGDDDQRGFERDAQAEVHAFEDGAQRDRTVAVADLDGDGLSDLVTTDPAGASLLVYRQGAGSGLGAATRCSAFKDPKAIAVGQWNDDPALEVFVLSETEKTVGVASWAGGGRLGFPRPIPLATAGATPVAMSYVTFADGPAVIIVAKNKRTHTLEVHRRDGSEPFTIELENVTRPPQSILAADINRDGRSDLLLFTPSEPMVMVLADRDGRLTDIRTEKNTSQFGLVEEAGPDNTALLDVTGDGSAELLIADQNFVRACRYDDDQGWAVIDQITLPDAQTRFAGLTLLHEPGASAGSPPTIVGADSANGRLVMIRSGGSVGVGAWSVDSMLRLTGVELGKIFAGRFTGDGEPSILALSDDAFSIVRLTGSAETLEPVVVHRNDNENRLEHEITVGDINGDGYTDLVVLDAGEQMCEVLTCSGARKLLPATEFEVYQSRLFSGGESREFEPSDAIIADLTGDGADDLALLVHDRVIIYPQATRR